jgi:hypothetical protein
MTSTRRNRPAPPAEPGLLARGRYAIYQDPSGAGIIVYRPDGENADGRQVVPAAIWRVILAALRGDDVGPGAVVKALTVRKEHA